MSTLAAVPAGVPVRAYYRTRLASSVFAALTFILIAASASEVAAQPPIATIGLTPGWATFGQAVPQGLAPAGSGLRVGQLPTQTDIKNTWPDGSIKFAIITVRVPSAGNYALTPAAISTSTFAPAIPTASATFNIGGVIYTATPPSGPSADTWLTGPLAYEGRSVVTPTASGNPHPFLRVIFDTRVFNDGTARVDVAVENVLDLVGATAVTYDVTLAVNGVSVFSKPAVQHFYLTRWRKTLTLPSTSVATITPDLTPFNVSRALPPYLPVVTNRVDQIDLASDPGYDIMGTGALGIDMSALAGRGALAPYPDWTARYLVHKDPAQRAFVLANGDLAGSWPVHVREAEASSTSGVSSGRFISINQRPTVWFDQEAQTQGADFIKGTPLPIKEYTSLCAPPPASPPAGCQNVPAGQTRLIPDNAHQPSLAYVPYLLTGDRYYADEMMFWANYAMLRTSDDDAVRGSLGILAHNEVRGFGWALRNLADAAAYHPDAAVRSYLSEKVLSNLRWLDDYANSQDSVTNPLKLLWPGYRPESGFISLWEQTYLAWAIDRANRLGFVGGLAHRDAIAGLQLKLFTSEPDWPRETVVQSPGVTLFDGTFAPAGTVLTWGMPYLLDYGTVSSPSVFTYNKTIAEVWAQTDNPSVQRPFAGFYGPEARLNLMIGIEAGWNGAQSAYDYLWPFIGVNAFWDTLAGRTPDLSERAGWAVDFYPGAATTTTAVAMALLQDPTPALAELLTPAAGAAFGSSAQSFTWSAGTGVTAYKLDLGTTPGAANLHAGVETQAQSELVTGLPVDGRTVWVRLSSKIDGAFQFIDYSFTSYTAPNPATSPKTVPTITWAPPRDIAKGTALTATQLNATANVPGTFVYSPAAGTVLNAGSGQTLSVTFYPADTGTYQSATATVLLNVLNPPTVTFTPTNPATVAPATAFVAVDVVALGGGTTPTPAKIGTAIAGTFKDATGHSGQSHLVFSRNTNRWWLFTLTSASDALGNRKVQSYVSSGPDLATATWTAASASPTLSNTGGATSSVLAGGRSLGVGLRTNGTVDYVHVFVSAAFDGQNSSNGHVRATLAPGTITWGAWDNPGAPNTASEWQGPANSGNPPSAAATHSSWGNSVGISSGGFIHHFSTTMDQEVDCAVGRSTNADTAATWTNGFGTNAVGDSPTRTTAVIDKSMAHECKVLAFAPLASNVMLAVYGNGMLAQPQINNLRYTRSGAAGKWTNISAATGGGNGDVFGTTAQIDQNDWALVPGSTTTIYTFRAKAAGTGVDGVVYNTGTNTWSALTGSSVPPAFGTGQSFKSGGGLFGATDGTNVWLFAINGAATDAADSILFTKFNGSSSTWTPWSVVPGTDAGTHTRSFITGFRSVSSNQIGLAWTEGSTTVDVFTTSLDIGPSSVTATMSTPTSGSTVSGTTAVSASASSTAGTIAGVQFKLDGANLGVEDTTSPYSVSWDTTTASAGTHFLSAVARDSTGATGFTDTVSVTVDTTPPTVSMIAPATGATVTGTSVVVAADASDDVGVVGVQFLLDGAALGAEVTSTPYAITWNATTATSGTHTLSARARDAAGRTTVSASISVTIPANKVTPTITWAAPAAISYGTPLGAEQFNATASVPGTFVYSPAVGTVLPVGTGQLLSVSFTPDDPTLYTTAGANVSITVVKGTPVITWPSPAGIFYGTPLGTQLNASASVPGTFAYTPASGTVLSAGAAQTLSVTFTPTDATNYAVATSTVAIDVFKATPTITWPTPSPIAFGTLLGSEQLNATADVRGTFTYSPPAGSVLSPGTQTLTVSFTPADTGNYTVPGSKSVLLTVTKGTPDISWPQPAAIVYGTALGGAELNATSTVPGTFVYAPAAGTVLPAGVNTLAVTFTPADPASYANATASVTITVSKATPTVSWPTPADIRYGTTLSTSQLNAATSVPGTLVYTPAAGALLSAGAGQTLSVIFTPTDAANYTPVTKTVSINVLKATPTITWATPADITYGTSLSSTQLNASSTTLGAFAYTPALGVILNAGAGQTLSVTFTPTDGRNFTTATKTVSINILKSTSTITWPTPADITFGTALSATQLNATSATPGAFAYAPAAGVVLNAGAGQTLSVTFTPTDAANFATVTRTVPINVLKATPTITWPAPADITYGTGLSATQLNATANTPGTFVYNPGVGTVLNAGADRSLSVTFTPTDAANFTTATRTVNINVLKATPTITWATPADITYGTALSATQLNATVSGGLVGSFVYTPAAGQVLNAGTQTLSVTFSPTDANYAPATKTVSLTVNPATPTITWTNPAAITYGTPLGATQLNATVSGGLAGAFVYSPAAGQVPNAGTQTLLVTFTPTDPNYGPATKTVSLTVNPATPTITWTNPAAITYGTALGAAQLNATANIPGTFTYTPALGVLLSAGAAQILSVTFTPTDAANFTPTTKTASITVLKATPAVSWTPAAISYGTTAQLNATATGVGGVTLTGGTFSYTLNGQPLADQVLGAASYQVTVSFTPSAADAGNYTTASLTVTLTVTKATPVINWGAPASIIYGTALNTTDQLNATTTPAVVGDFAYTVNGSSADGQRLNVGTYTITAIFTPTDTNYTTATATRTITVSKAPPVITWAAPAEITYGTKLGSAQLNATVNVNGTLAYTPVAGAILEGGSRTLSVTFTPDDSANYSSATKSVSIFVRKSQPYMNIDGPLNNSVSGSSLTVGGWALDLGGSNGSGVDAVHVWAYPRSGEAPIFLGAATMGLDRQDVSTSYGAPRLRYCGFGLRVSNLAAGGYQLVVFARSEVTGTFNQSMSVNVTIAAPNPVVTIDAPAKLGIVNPTFTVSGWAIDRSSTTGAGIDALHVYAYPAAGGSPVFLGIATYGAARPDVAAIYGKGFTPSGFSLTTTAEPGTYTIVIYPHSTVSGSFVFLNPAFSQITVAMPVSRPALSIDTPAAGAVVGETFDIAGWAIDLSSWTGTGIDTLHAWAYPESGGAPQFLGVAAYGSARPDVGNIFGSLFTPSGFRITFMQPLTPGRYSIVVYPHSTISGTFGNPTVVRVTVGTPSTRAVMAPDRPIGDEDPNRVITGSERPVPVPVVTQATRARSDARPSRSAENRNSSPPS